MAERNSDYHEAVKKICFSNVSTEYWPVTSRLHTDAHFQGRAILSHDYVFWAGDFNYRINMERDQVIDMVNKKVNVFMPCKKV